MGYIDFDKSKLVNLGYSLKKELLRSNRAGAFASTTIVGCNTRKYHGLLIVRQPEIDNDYHVLLSSLDVSVIQHNAEFNLGIHKYAGNVYNPKGHKYISDFESDPIPRVTYHVGGVHFTVERLFIANQDRILIKLTLEDAHSPTLIRLKPFLAFRNRHSLSRANDHADTSFESVPHGIKMKLYPGYSPLYLQTSKNPSYVHLPEWYYGIEYSKEQERGYEFREDLLVPGYLELPLKKGESIIFTAGTEAADPSILKKAYTSERKNRVPRDSFRHCLENAAQQFINKRDNHSEVIAGYPWLAGAGRDTFVALPGLMLSTGDIKNFEAVVDTMVSEMKGPFFPEKFSPSGFTHESADTPLWFFYALQKYNQHIRKPGYIWKKFGGVMKYILEEYRKGPGYNIKMDENGLLHTGSIHDAMTWMDVKTGGIPLTPRNGYAVEVNALWYNAIRFTLELAMANKDQEFINEWSAVADIIPASFTEVFWNKEKGYLADYVDGGFSDWSVRPNMVFAVSMPYSPVSDEIKADILHTIERELLTRRGLRSLSPQDSRYKGVYAGTPSERDQAYHMGAAFPWLLGHYVEGYLRIYGEDGLSSAQKIYSAFEEEMPEHGIGTISEVYDGDPPHEARGCISQAWCVAELLRINEMIENYKK
ncbi:MAG: glycogen debranching enzyme family protein [Bacteroidales bacterium]|nr:glycogen debranching enzyme family protein [Bacteroidales bacterium]